MSEAVIRGGGSLGLPGSWRRCRGRGDVRRPRAAAPAARLARGRRGAERDGHQPGAACPRSTAPGKRMMLRQLDRWGVFAANLAAVAGLIALGFGLLAFVRYNTVDQPAQAAAARDVRRRLPADDRAARAVRAPAHHRADSCCSRSAAAHVLSRSPVRGRGRRRRALRARDGHARRGDGGVFALLGAAACRSLSQLGSCSSGSCGASRWCRRSARSATSCCWSA